MTEIRVNDPHDGVWIMERAQGIYNERVDHCLSVHRNGQMRGGVVFTGYMGTAMVVHMAGDGTNWATRDFLWMVYDYSFNQIRVKKLLGMVASGNTRALNINLRMGFHIAARIEGILPNNEDLIVVVMDRQDARWLNIKPRYVKSLAILDPVH